MLLPDLLTTDLPAAELCAARLDGELFPLADGWVPIDRIDDPALRLAGVLAQRGPRLIAELGTAAWVWGATPVAPHRIEVCARSAERVRLPRSDPARLREVVLDPGDTSTLGGRTVTSPLRTAVDLARLDRAPDPEVLRALGRIGGFGSDDVDAMLDRRRNLPDKRRARAILHAALGEEPGPGRAQTR